MPGTSSFDEHILVDPEVSRLLSAAVINQNFRRILLSDPASALRAGFNGENFKLSPGIKERIISIHARTLADFASQILVEAPVQPQLPRIMPAPTYASMAISPGLD